MFLDESGYSVALMQENSWKPLPLWGHLSDQRAPFLFFHLSLVVVISYFCAKYKLYTWAKKIKNYPPFLDFLFSPLPSFCFFFSSFPSLPSLPSAFHPCGSALCLNHRKLNGNIWRLIYSQIPRIPGYEVTQCLSCASLLTFTARKWKYSPTLTRNHCGLNVRATWVRTIEAKAF